MYSFNLLGRSAVIICLQLSLQASQASDEAVISGKIAEVVVSREQARIVRTLTLPAAPEPQRIRVPGLPSDIDLRTAFTESDAGTHVRSMRIVSDQTTTDPEISKRLAQLQSTRSDLLQQLLLQENKATVIEQDLLTIDKLVDFSGERAKQDLDRASLDVSAVTALADFTMERRRKLAAEFMQTQIEIKETKAKIERNHDEQSALTDSSLIDTYEAQLVVSSPAGGTVKLVYDVARVRWVPRYSIRSAVNEDGERRFTIDLDAVVIQDSGENWDDVSLTLSTSAPNRRSSRPLLTPLRIKATESGAQPERRLARRTSDAHPLGWLDRTAVQQDAHLNLIASQRQVTELLQAPEVRRGLAEDAGDQFAEETYQIERPVRITSHPQPQTIAVLSAELPGSMHRVVTPLLSSFAFREAELTNASGKNLISGDVEVYLDGNLVGRTTLSPTASGQRLTIGFGTDRKLRTRRELLGRTESIQGGNRRSVLKHRLVVSNYHETPVDVRLLDRIPIAAEDGSIGIDFDATSTAALSSDKLYLRMQRPTGVLRWDLQVPAMRFGSNAFDHEYSYSIEFDRQQTIVSNDLTSTLSDLQFQKMNSGGMGGGMGGMGL